MNNFPPWWDQTITVYNKRILDNRAVEWTRTVLTNCFWKYIYDKNYVFNRNMTNNALSEIEDVICRIPINDNFVTPGQWSSLEDVTDKFTLQDGDIIIYGEVDDEINEYVAGKRKTDILNKYKKYQECIEVKTHVTNIWTGNGLPHYRVIGK